MGQPVSDYRNPTIEAWIESYGITDYELEMVNLTKINVKSSLNNQARLKPLDKEMVDRIMIRPKPKPCSHRW